MVASSDDSTENVSRKGFITLELMIAIAVMVTSISAVILVAFGNQSLSIDTELAQRALYLAEQKLEKAGAFSIVLECVPYELGRRITEALRIPTIGIGAGPYTDGQVLVLHDLLGFKSNVHPRFVRRYAKLEEMIEKALQRYRSEVLEGKFPNLEESFK